MYSIVGQHQGKTPEEIDSAMSESEALHLISEYQLAFGPDWKIWMQIKSVDSDSEYDLGPHSWKP